MREDHDMTQQQVADAIGITQRKYSYIETGTQQLTGEILIKLANLYHVSIDYLLAQTDNPRRNDKTRSHPGNGFCRWRFSMKKPPVLLGVGKTSVKVEKNNLLV